MNRLAVVIFLLLSSIFTVQGQTTYSVRGVVQDTINLKAVPFASVSLIRKSDSILTRFTRTNEKGQFELKINDAGPYLLLIAHTQFVDYVDDVVFAENKSNIDLGTIPLFQRGQLLKEVIIRNAAAIRIKGDTLEYLADSFKVRQGAMVEDLLKVMPGIQVNKKGEITAMGEKVEKVLVDGEEFFGDDPTVATQNIQSKVVEKVQVFDKKSDQAQFTGFDDGQTEKTINLKLKDNMNRGLFGKIELGGGLNDRWNNQVMVNSFKNKRQISAYGIMSSNGKTGLGWEDRNTFAGDGGGGMQMDEDGAFIWNMPSEDDDNFGRGVPEGITKAWTGGTRYANKWNDNKHTLNSNYSFGRINQEKRETSYTENMYPNNRFYTYDTTNSFTSRNTHRLTTRYTWSPDTMTNIIFNLNARLATVESETFNSTRNVTETTETLMNSSSRNNKNEATTGRISNSLTVNRKLKKTGRTLSLNTSYVHSDNGGNGMLEGLNTFNSGMLISDTLDQRKEQAQIVNTLNTDLSYTEPLSKKLLLKTSYAYGIDGNFSKKSTLIKNDPNETNYVNRIDSLSSDFNSIIQSHTVGAEFKWVEKKYNLTVGSRFRYSSFNQEDLVRNLNYDYGRWNIFPTIRFNYKFDQFSRIQMSYSGSTRQPSISQLQPVQDNNNPLSLTIGNPNLKIGFSQNINASYFNYKVISSRSIYAGFNFSNTFNNISLSRYVDNIGRTISQYININGGYNGSVWGGLYARIPKTQVNGKLNFSGNFNHTPNEINAIRSVTNTLSLTFTPGINYTIDEKLYLDIDLGTLFTNTQTTVPNGRDIRFLSFVPSASLTWTLPKNFEISTDADYVYNPPVGPYATPFNRLLWNGALLFRTLDNKNLTFKFSVNDILRQNRGYERTTTANFNQERNFMTLTRFWMITAIWNFNDGPMAAAQQGNGSMRRPGGMPGGRRPSGGGRRMGR